MFGGLNEYSYIKLLALRWIHYKCRVRICSYFLHLEMLSMVFEVTCLWEVGSSQAQPSRGSGGVLPLRYPPWPCSGPGRALLLDPGLGICSSLPLPFPSVPQALSPKSLSEFKQIFSHCFCLRFRDHGRLVFFLSFFFFLVFFLEDVNRSGWRCLPLNLSVLL